MRRRRGGNFALLAGVDVAGGYRRRRLTEKVGSDVDSRRGGRWRGRAGGGRRLAVRDVGGGGEADVQARAVDGEGWSGGGAVV